MIYLEIVESVLYVLDVLILFVQVLKVFHLILRTLQKLCRMTEHFLRSHCCMVHWPCYPMRLCLCPPRPHGTAGSPAEWQNLQVGLRRLSPHLDPHSPSGTERLFISKLNGKVGGEAISWITYVVLLRCQLENESLPCICNVYAVKLYNTTAVKQM